MLPIIYSEAFLRHQTGIGHPEKPERLTAIVGALKSAPWASELLWELPTPVDSDRVLKMVETIHSLEHLELLKMIATTGGGAIDADTPISPDSYDVALLAVSAWLDGVDRVLTTGKPAFVLARPPGHHATRDDAMGFCLLSNAAIAAHYALKQPQIQRVAILDWDVHHGNGTQAIVESNPQIAYCSLHQFPCYPGTGRASERGFYENVLNLPMLAHSTITEYQKAFSDRVVPFLTQFQPDLLIVSAGYDANALDPLASIDLQPQDYGIFTDYCLQITNRVVFGLEGGYHLPALAQSVQATIASCLKNTP
ncbi:histone deacetylase [Gloeocapsa sp. PCC 73106]|uniref:histone deacetylase family protein n=1 Tax=Gloeocapsa sp. PCC 73106 TaxID=102232 RepID=UPI0002ABC057|nr:histone deacetylase [Gloeocapsa sp. PCC 73106]ELR97801.1 deacetylase, histone deacetylase/acetoin utilization protein [Gloeocapsa sp. PCC 73106]